MINNDDFCSAVHELQHGHKVAREAWQAGVFLVMPNIDFTDPLTDENIVVEYIMIISNNKANYWNPTQADIFAIDWSTV